MARTRIYTPAQIALGSLWGGPIAAVYFLHQNFTALTRAREAGLTLVLGSLAVIAFVLALPLLPENFPTLLLPAGYSLLAVVVALRNHPSKETIANGFLYDFHSNWRVVLSGLIALGLIIVLAIAVMLGLSLIGVLDLR